MSVSDAVDGASSDVSKCYTGWVESESNQGGETTANLGAEALKELARTRRRNADKVDPGIGRTRLGQRIFECVFLIGTRSAHSIMASGFTAAQTGRTHDRTPTNAAATQNGLSSDGCRLQSGVPPKLLARADGV